jgi:hypothetical protein
MPRLLVAVALVAFVPGCISPQPWSQPIAPPVAIYTQNPILVPARDPQQLWETVADVMNDYFRIAREEPVRGTLTEGRLETFPEIGSTIFEPWRGDSADPYERWESTLQSIQRQASLRVTPDPNGYLIEVVVEKRLEDVAHPSHSPTSSATFRNDSSLARVISPLGEPESNRGWIPLGRDKALEQRILAQLESRLGTVRKTSPAPACTQPY